MNFGSGAVIFGQQRDQLRRVFIDVWHKHRAGAQLEPMERTIASVIAAHPQYHGILAEPTSVFRDFPFEGQETNPFLHMAMHIAIVEQITSDRPTGIRASYDALRAGIHHTHELEHAMMECLAGCLRDAQELNQSPDEQSYLACIRRLERRVSRGVSRNASGD